MRRVVKISDFVYWVEIDHYECCNEERKPIYKVCKGHYLASYAIGEMNKHIVSLNSITSCVVRHLDDDNIFYNEEKAYKVLKEKNNG